MRLNNPAGRLLLELRETVTRPAQRTALEGWCDIWDLDASTFEGQAECLRRGHLLIATYLEMREQASKLGSAAGASMERLPQVEATLASFQTLPSITLAQQMGQLKADGWLALETLDGMLSDAFPEPVINGSEYISLLEQTQDLIREVLNDDSLSETVKRQIANSLRDVEQALIDTSIAGTANVDRAANGLAGVLVRLYAVGENVAGHKVTKAVFGLVFAIDLALNAGANYQALTASDPMMKVLVSDPAELVPQPTPAIEPPVPDEVTAEQDAETQP